MTTALCKSNKDDFKYNIIFGRLFHDKPKITETSWGWAGPSSAEIEVENGGFLLVIKLINLMIWGLVINLINFAFLSGGKIKNNDQLSPAEALVEAELGNTL